MRRWVSTPYLTAPVYLPTASRLGRRMRRYNHLPPGPSQLRWTATIALELARRALTPYRTLLLVDQGFVNLIRKHSSEPPTHVFASLPVPSVVIHVTAPAALRAARVALRTADAQSVLPDQRHTSSPSLALARQHARRWYAIGGPAYAHQCLRAWSRASSASPFTSYDLARLTDYAAKDSLTPDDLASLTAPQLDQSTQWLYSHLASLGVHWINVLNDGQTDIVHHAGTVARQLLAIHESSAYLK